MLFIPVTNDNNEKPSVLKKNRKWWGTMLTPKLMENKRLLNNSERRDGNQIVDVSIDSQTDELVYLNVSGRRFTTTTQTLENFPNSLLGNKEQRDLLPRTKSGEIFLNRHPNVFESVLTFYQRGIFEPPSYVNQNIFVEDVTFYGLQNEALESGLKGFDLTKVPFPTRKWQAYIWNLLEYPDSSLLARIVSFISLLVILVSITIFCWETVPKYRQKYNTLSDSDRITVDVLKDVEIFCITYFTFELLARFLSSPKKCLFVKDILNIIDLISILPFFMTLIFNLNERISIYFLRAVRLVRVFRVFKLSRHSSEMKILGIAVKDSARELGVLLFFILLGVLLFSSAVYYAEGNVEESKLKSIPGAFWWSIVTMTTVGYGDEVPVTIAGRLVGAVAAMTGILVIAMPIPIIVNNFTRQYQRLKPVSKFYDQLRARNTDTISITKTRGLYSLHDVLEEHLSTSTSESHVPRNKVNNNCAISNLSCEINNENRKEQTSIQIESTL